MVAENVTSMRPMAVRQFWPSLFVNATKLDGLDSCDPILFRHRAGDAYLAHFGPQVINGKLLGYVFASFPFIRALSPPIPLYIDIYALLSD